MSNPTSNRTQKNSYHQKALQQIRNSLQPFATSESGSTSSGISSLSSSNNDTFRQQSSSPSRHSPRGIEYRAQQYPFVPSQVPPSVQQLLRRPRIKDSSPSSSSSNSPTSQLAPIVKKPTLIIKSTIVPKPVLQTAYSVPPPLPPKPNKRNNSNNNNNNNNEDSPSSQFNSQNSSSGPSPIRPETTNTTSSSSSSVTYQHPPSSVKSDIYSPPSSNSSLQQQHQQIPQPQIPPSTTTTIQNQQQQHLYQHNNNHILNNHMTSSGSSSNNNNNNNNINHINYNLNNINNNPPTPPLSSASSSSPPIYPIISNHNQHNHHHSNYHHQQQLHHHHQIQQQQQQSQTQQQLLQNHRSPEYYNQPPTPSSSPKNLPATPTPVQQQQQAQPQQLTRTSERTEQNNNTSNHNNNNNNNTHVQNPPLPPAKSLAFNDSNSNNNNINNNSTNSENSVTDNNNSGRTNNNNNNNNGNRKSPPTQVTTHESPIPERKKLSREKEEERFESKVRVYSPQAFKFFMEQHVENILKSHQERLHRRLQLEKEMAKIGLSESAQTQMRKMLSQKESNYIRLKRAKMDKSMFKQIRRIGVGAFGEVALVRKLDTQHLYAMKTLRKSDVLRRNQVAHVKAERDILAEADNEWVVKLYYSFQDSDHLYFVMDYIPGGDLMSLLIKKGIFEESLAQFYIAELTCAVESVHKMGFIHRDIKPDNILIDRDGHIKLTDFGLCTGFRWTHNSKYYQDSNSCHCEQNCQWQTCVNDKPLLERRRKNEHIRCLAHSLVGTPNYIAPEVLMRTGYTQLCDWWSVGVIMYEMLVGQPPFLAANSAETQYKVINFKSTLRVPPEAQVSSHAKDLILKLCADHTRRLGKSAEDVKSHPFFNSIDFESGLRLKTAPYVPEIRHPTDTSNFDPCDSDRPEDIDGPFTSNQFHGFYEFTFRRFFDDAYNGDGPVYV